MIREVVSDSVGAVHSGAEDGLQVAESTEELQDKSAPSLSALTTQEKRVFHDVLVLRLSVLPAPHSPTADPSPDLLPGCFHLLQRADSLRCQLAVGLGQLPSLLL